MTTCPDCKSELAPNVLSDGAWCLRCNREWTGKRLAVRRASVNAFQQNLRAEVDGLHRQADLAEQQLATGLWGGNSQTMRQLADAALQGALYGAGQLTGNRIANDAQAQQAYTYSLRNYGHIASPEPTRAEPERAVCVCGAEIHPIRFVRERMCGDCLAMSIKDPHAPLDSRIAAAQEYGDVGPWDARDAEYEL